MKLGISVIGRCPPRAPDPRARSFDLPQHYACAPPAPSGSQLEAPATAAAATFRARLSIRPCTSHSAESERKRGLPAGFALSFGVAPGAAGRGSAAPRPPPTTRRPPSPPPTVLPSGTPPPPPTRSPTPTDLPASTCQHRLFQPQRFSGCEGMAATTCDGPPAECQTPMSRHEALLMSCWDLSEPRQGLKPRGETKGRSFGP